MFDDKKRFWHTNVLSKNIIAVHPKKKYVYMTSKVQSLYQRKNLKNNFKKLCVFGHQSAIVVPKNVLKKKIKKFTFAM